ncbi:hypothetical protein Dtox_2682 [Desulfofarcimen acetoxidans DSM 771]|jgi:hypothetical protein|uniref:Uncharacterized protein n=1 Tax=Desulfofarcimen acetoxidans (strain ATCC 49208 / DSM 771 / KCTC 5769 / VKM B-1644 / 5575) TaxID=485916 RepID=C8W168_DESAS|nr:hypothetical protein Dtox_2682 [Desulfofarcimen acetoxidans DSM 771]
MRMRVISAEGKEKTKLESELWIQKGGVTMTIDLINEILKDVGLERIEHDDGQDEPLDS